MLSLVYTISVREIAFTFVWSLTTGALILGRRPIRVGLVIFILTFCSGSRSFSLAFSRRLLADSLAMAIRCTLYNSRLIVVEEQSDKLKNAGRLGAISWKLCRWKLVKLVASFFRCRYPILPCVMSWSDVTSVAKLAECNSKQGLLERNYKSIWWFSAWATSAHQCSKKLLTSKFGPNGK